MQSIRTKLERFSLAATPAVVTVFMLLLAAVPMHVTGLRQMMPDFVLINIYYWNMFLPGALPYSFLFGLGLFEDALSGLPIGVSCAVNLFFALLLLREHRSFGKAQFRAVWFGFALLSLVAMMLKWVIMSFAMGGILPMSSQLLVWGATCLAYPSLHIVLTRAYRVLLIL